MQKVLIAGRLNDVGNYIYALTKDGRTIDRELDWMVYADYQRQNVTYRK